MRYITSFLVILMCPVPTSGWTTVAGAWEKLPTYEVTASGWTSLSWWTENVVVYKDMTTGWGTTVGRPVRVATLRRKGSTTGKNRRGTTEETLEEATVLEGTTEETVEEATVLEGITEETVEEATVLEEKTNEPATEESNEITDRKEEASTQSETGLGSKDTTIIYDEITTYPLYGRCAVLVPSMIMVCVSSIAMMYLSFLQ